MVSLFRSHDPPFVVPYDYPDRYTRTDNRDDGYISVVAGQFRHWRTVESMTVTFATRLRTVLARWGALPHPLNDRERAYALIEVGEYVLGPMPGLAAHMERFVGAAESYVPLYFDWVGFARAAFDAANFDGYTLQLGEC